MIHAIVLMLSQTYNSKNIFVIFTFINKKVLHLENEYIDSLRTTKIKIIETINATKFIFINIIIKQMLFK